MARRGAVGASMSSAQRELALAPCSASRWRAAARRCCRSARRRRRCPEAPQSRPQATATQPPRRPSASTSASWPPMAAPTTIPSSKALLNQTVEKLVAASERPDLRYRVTILNSPAVNAFALPTGQLYVTRGLIALANDTSELASVLSHEMSHVIARHAAIREDQARQVALVSRVVQRRAAAIRKPARWRSPNRRSRWRASRARRNSRPTASASASRRAPATIPTARCASSPRWDATPSSRPTPARRTSIRARPISSPRIRRRPSASRTRRPMPASSAAPGAGERDRPAYLAGIDGMVYGEDPSEGFVRGRRFLHPKLGFTFVAPEGFTLDNTAQAVLGVKDGGGQALRLDVVRVPAEQTLADYLNSGWIENIDPKTRRGPHHQRLPGGDRDRQGRPVVVPALCGALRQRRLSLHLRDQAHDRGDRPRVPRIGRHLPPHDAGGEPGGEAAAPQGRHRRAGRHGRAAGEPDGDRPTARSSASACSTGSAPNDRVKPGDQVKLVVE